MVRAEQHWVGCSLDKAIYTLAPEAMCETHRTLVYRHHLCKIVELDNERDNLGAIAISHFRYPSCLSRRDTYRYTCGPIAPTRGYAHVSELRCLLGYLDLHGLWSRDLIGYRHTCTRKGKS